MKSSDERYGRANSDKAECLGGLYVQINASLAKSHFALQMRTTVPLCSVVILEQNFFLLK